jgi:hypothetical protein
MEQMAVLFGTMFHSSADECYAAHQVELPSCTDNWIVGQIPGEKNFVGKTIIFELEM